MLPLKFDSAEDVPRQKVGCEMVRVRIPVK